MSSTVWSVPSNLHCHPRPDRTSGACVFDWAAVLQQPISLTPRPNQTRTRRFVRSGEDCSISLREQTVGRSRWFEHNLKKQSSKIKLDRSRNPRVTADVIKSYNSTVHRG
ncbi:hypothetical protein Y032_0005g2321 [Ancylostoma ceylanicum]|uniref:Uncharacterized protein n=1 Tax=Ancylostoma ceylanicum TaxID=53326 RepID=A0A016VR44_9BILA|nr:hypothetical protein Y032_0005g2321 [Ancylostoma ceylanicum]